MFSTPLWCWAVSTGYSFLFPPSSRFPFANDAIRSCYIFSLRSFFFFPFRFLVRLSVFGHFPISEELGIMESDQLSGGRFLLTFFFPLASGFR